jgi:hypothetical protein
MLQIRIVTPEFSAGTNFVDPVILESADSIQLTKGVQVDDESISFTVPITDPKYPLIDYLKWWECWDTVTNERLNYGPIDAIEKPSIDNRKISGPGRSARLRDFYKTLQTFNYPIDQFLDDLRYENLCEEPRTSAIVNKRNEGDYYGLSKRTKDNAIDSNTGYISPGRDTPSRSTIKTDSMWMGIDRSDALIIDLGEKYNISKARILLPWWGGVTRNNNRSYDWSLGVCDTPSFTDWTPLYATGSNNETRTTLPKGTTFYMGESGFESSQVTISGVPVESRYWVIDIQDTHAWYGVWPGGGILPSTKVDEWGWECGGSDNYHGDFHKSPTNGTINTKSIRPDSDCYASVVEVEFLQKIIDLDYVSKTYYQQIENTSRQITYRHVPESSEVYHPKAGSPNWKFEPGTTFRRINFDWDGGSLDRVTEEWNTTLYSNGDSSGTRSQPLPAYAKYVLWEGPGSVTINWVDAWQGKLDPMSYGGSYSYSKVADDTALLKFRGESLKWFATVPTTERGALVDIDLRSKNDVGIWSSWTHLESSMLLPSGVSGEKVWEITYESGVLQPDIVYEARITNVDGGFVGIDAFTGYWSGSYKEYNEDDPQIRENRPDQNIQKYDASYTNGSIYQFDYKAGPIYLALTFAFTGDRVIVYSRREPHAGKIKLAMDDHLTNPIPGGDSDGGLIVDLEGGEHTIPQFVIFDSDLAYTGANALPWGNHYISIYDPGNEVTSSQGPLYIDGFGSHNTGGVSVKFDNTSYLDILKSTVEALQMEAEITDKGLLVIPRLGKDTNIIVKEGARTVIKIEDTEDVSKIATMLQLTGSDIDGLPLTGVVEDKTTRNLFGRTIQRTYDLRNVSDYTSLIGLGRTELMRRREPELKMTISHTGDDWNIDHGDSFYAIKDGQKYHVRATAVVRNQSRSGGTTYDVECEKWPKLL